MNALVAASAAFFLLHLLPSTPLRGRLISFAKEGPYLGAFSLLSLISIWWLASSFGAAPGGSKFWDVPVWWLWLEAALILFALILTVSGFLSPNPSSPGAANLLGQRNVGEGIFAITRHPVMWGIAIWAIAHIIGAATLRGIAFFGAFAATALIGSWLQQRRKQTLPGWAAFEAKTSFLPFAAILQGRAKLRLGSIGWWRIAMAIIVWALILHFHTRLFGVQPLPIYT